MGSGKLPFNAPLMKMTAMPSQKWSLIEDSLEAQIKRRFSRFRACL
jgi:hypothetical protein